MGKKNKTKVAEKETEIMGSLKKLGTQMYNQLDSGVFPSINMPSRSTENINYDPHLRQYILGGKTVTRSARNIRHVKPFTQLAWAALFSNELHIFPEERSAVFGDLTIEYTVPGYEGKTLNLSAHPDGVLIGPAFTTSKFTNTSADKIIAIEKGGLFTRFIEENVHTKHKSILVLTSGQAPRQTRYFLRRLSDELKIPLYIFTDGDPWGMHIAMVIISGSANAAHLRNLNTPDAKWSGVWASDIVKYKLPSDPLDEVDIKRLHELQKDPRYQEDPLWQKEIKIFLKIKRKAELEAYARYGLTYIVDKYLPTKLK